MTIRRALASLLLLLLATIGSSPLAPASAEDAALRVSFRIRTLVGPAGAQTTASDATVDGPPGTDIALEGKAGVFTMTAKLKTDLVTAGRVRVVADVTTRRAAGTSERGRQLFEEDSQRRTVELAADGSESLVVLPFGRNPDGEELAIDIAPALSNAPARTPTGEPAPLRIRIDAIGPDGWLRVDAEKVPHRYDVEATLERDGREIARGAARCELGEPGTVPIATEDSTFVALRLTVNEFERLCPNGSTGFTFDVVEPRTSTPIARQWSGVAAAGAPTSYDLGQLAEKITGGPTTLRLRITPIGDSVR